MFLYIIFGWYIVETLEMKKEIVYAAYFGNKNFCYKVTVHKTELLSEKWKAKERMREINE